MTLPLLDDHQSFRQEHLHAGIISLPLSQRYQRSDTAQRVIIDLNLEYPGGVPQAAARVMTFIQVLGTAQSDLPAAPALLIGQVSQYIFASLTQAQVLQLVALDKQGPLQAMFRIWPDFEVAALLHRSVPTVKGDAAHTAFSAVGKGITWAVLDSGIDETHPHFARHGNLVLEPGSPLAHQDFTGSAHGPLSDECGHGTHVAGIIAGELNAADHNGTLSAVTSQQDESGDMITLPLEVPQLSGVAPRCRLLSYKVLDQNGQGLVSSLILALDRVNELNGYGRRLLVHGVNLSVGYGFDAEWFACGQSPLCVEVNRLVRSGVVVVTAAGNTGYGFQQSAALGAVKGALDLSINDPGNAEFALTVGATHRDMPHIYGVSYFSSKGPTGDGRMKPDLVAPGERILSCAAGAMKATSEQRAGTRVLYLEQSGTSMAAPHVSGAIAAFLSIRREFIGQPDEVKRVFMDSSTSLGRAPAFQGQGLVDLMRAIQSV